MFKFLGGEVGVDKGWKNERREGKRENGGMEEGNKGSCVKNN